MREDDIAGVGMASPASVIDMEPIQLDLEIHESKLQEGALAVISNIRPDWTPNRIGFKIFTDGITNKLIGCYLDNDMGDMVLVRVYGQNTDLLIDRKAETNNFKLLQRSGYAPQLYATFNNGLAYEFVPGQVLTPESVHWPTVFPLVARMMARFHHLDCGPDIPRCPVIWSKATRYLGLIPSSFAPELQERFEADFTGGVEALVEEVVELEKRLSHTESKVVFCHNDLLLANIIHQTGKVTFIDYEYAAYNYQAYDIGNHFAEFAGVSDVDYSRYPNKEFQYEWLRIYLEEYNECMNNHREVTESEIDNLYIQVNKFSLASHLLWATWALVQAHHSTIDFDFMGYAIMRMKEYYKRKTDFLSLDLS